MKVKELIELLQSQDPEMRVVVNGYEGGYSDIEDPFKTELHLNVYRESYYGKHEIALKSYRGKTHKAFVLPRRKDC